MGRRKKRTRKRHHQGTSRPGLSRGVALQHEHHNLPSVSLKMLEYTLTDEPLEDPRYARLPKHVKDRMDELYGMTVTNPKHVITEVPALIKKYPNVPTFYNYLSVAYSRIGALEQRDAVIRECCNRFPQYLFGKVNYAHICLENGHPEKIPEIFNGKFDLQLLYPHRTVFHVTEYLSFAGIVGLYYVHIGEKEAAKLLYSTMVQVDPVHLSTRQLRSALYPSKLVNVVGWILHIITGRWIRRCRDAFRFRKIRRELQVEHALKDAE